LAIGHISDSAIVSLVTMVGLITITGSSYYFIYADKIYHKIQKYLNVFEVKKPDSEANFPSQLEQYDIIVFGNHRT
jgi:hypothetical protein